MKRIILFLALITVLAGCNSAFKQAVTEADAALESGDYENALTLYNKALKEEPDSPEVRRRIDLLQEYNQLQVKIADSNWAEATSSANELLTHDQINQSMKRKLKELLVTIEEEEGKEKQFADSLEEIRGLLNQNKFEEADSKLSLIKSVIKTDALKKEAEDLHSELQAEKKRVDEEQAEKKRLEEEAKQLAAINAAKKQKIAKQNSKKQYMDRAQALQYRIAKEASDLYGNNTPPGFFGQYYDEWDDLLNEVWGVLKNTKSQEEFKTIKADQIYWINTKEEIFAGMPNETASSRGAGMDFLADMTSERTFYLIGNHIN